MHLIPISDFRKQAILLVIVGFIFYANSLFNEYALDDGIVILNNEYVLQGFKGVSKILSTDAYDSFYRSMGSKDQLSGGRYRPLTIVTFAIEQQLVGDNPFVRHSINVLLYLISLVLLLYFLHHFIFEKNPDLAFLTALIFAIHPIHTEVIANIKSRDEIVSLLLIMLTFIFALRFDKEKKIGLLLLGLVFYFLALLSKEYAITLIIIIPAMFYIFKRYDLSKSIVKVLPFAAVAILYLMIRVSVVGLKHIENPEVLNNPFLYASSPQKWATKISILNNYLQLLIFPHPLSSDYSYNQIPYKNFSSLSVWFSAFVHISMFVIMIKLFRKRHLIAFALLFYFAHLALISNLFMDIGATMGERLIYHSSFGFAIIAAYLILTGIEKLKTSLLVKRVVLYSSMSVVVLLFGFKTFERNAIWKNDITLFTNDVNIVPNSVLANGNAGARYIDLSAKPENKDKEKELINKGIVYLTKAVTIHPKYVNGFLNLGVAYYKLGDFENAELYWNQAGKYFPGNPSLRQFYPMLANAYLNKGMAFGGKNDFSQAIKCIEKASNIDPQNANIWYNLGGAYYTVKNFEKARSAWTQTMKIDPNNQNAKRGLEALGK